MKSPAVPVSTDMVPRLGRYVDLVLLGQGGMGAVYKGRDPDLDRPVAIKVVLDTSADFVERFRREAKAVARLHHPNVVQVYDFGQDDAGHPFFVMELVEGRPLDELLAERGRFSPDEIASVLAQAAAGLQAAHEAGIIHRDIKPSNLILDPKGRVKLVDFGIARLDNTPMLTSPSSLLGTPTYMSPEQVAGKPVDGRTDLYSLGISAFHLLTGRPPFEAREPIALALMHLNDPLPSLIERAPDTPPPLAALIVRLCAKEPDRRPATGKEVLASIEQIGPELGGVSRPLAAVAAAAVASDHPATVPPTRAGATAPEPEGKPFPTALVGGIGAVLAAAATVGVVLMIRPPKPPPATIDPPPVVAKADPPPKLMPGEMPPTHAPGPIVEKATVALPATGPVRVAVLKFKNLGADKDLEFLTEGIGETVLTELAGSSDRVSLVERNQVASETGEIDFGQTRYVDKSTAAALGKLAGVEVAVQGGFQRAGKTVRVSARFVRIETGEILDTVVITRPAARPDQLLAIQDAVAADLKKHLLDVATKVRGK
jgi:eukaryotic-like serine/threonine-protein kinase